MKKFLNKKYLLIYLIFLVGAFLRFYLLKERFLYTHDHDLASWMVKDVVVNKHLRLIGQQTSTMGVFIGPLYYYLLIPFYLIFKMDPIGGAILTSLLGIFGIFSFYWVFLKLFGKFPAIIAAIFYSTSFYMVANDREVVPTMPVFIWTIWFFYAINLIFKKKNKKAFIILAILASLIWHINFALILLFPLILLAVFLEKQKPKFKSLLPGIIVFFVSSLPLFLFETRHGFSQTKAIIAALTSKQPDVVSGIPKLLRVLSLASKNIANLFWGEIAGVSYYILPALLFLMFVFLLAKKIIDKKLGAIIVGWLFLYIAFFSSYSKIVADYYLNGMLLPVIIIFVLFMAHLFKEKRTRLMGVVILTVFVVYNINRFFSFDVNESGYTQRKAVVNEIAKNSRENGYPCIAISYITNPGYELGYRYLFWLKDMHVNRPEENRPVYTIVYPLRPIYEVDATFGAIGLIYPNYERYNIEEVMSSCSGQNSNLTDPMFGYTE